MSQSFLPDELEEVGIKDLLEGEEAYTVPWAMFADSEGALWIKGSYPFHQVPGGTVQMRIRRRAGMIEVFQDTIPEDHRFSRGKSAYVGGNDDAIPVILLKPKSN